MNGNRTRTGAICAAALALFAANVYVCRELFRREYLDQMGSIEAAFISIARYAAANLGDLTWFRLWYNGVPYQNTYPPLLHLTVALFSRLTGASAALSYHAVTAFLYCAGAVTLYALCLRFSRSVTYSFFAGLIYSVLSPSAFLVEDIRRDLGSVWRARRLQALLTYGEGPHVTGLALLPISILLLDVAIKRKRPIWTALAALSFAATVLTNWLAAAALGAAVVAYLAIDRSRSALVRIALVAALAYCFAAPWIPPSTIHVIQFNAKTIGGDFTHVYRTLPLYGGAVIAGLALLAFLFQRFQASSELRFAGVFAFLMSAITLPANYWNIYILPQPHRYHLEMEFGIAMLIPFLFRPLVERIPARGRMVLCLVLVLAAIAPAKHYRRYARILMTPIDITKTTEYRVARWFDEHMGGRQVFATGSISFWMNAWTDTPQLGGGFDQGTINFMNRVAPYLLYSDDGVTGDKVETSLLWLRAFGVDTVALSGPKGGEHFKPWRNPEKFDGRFEELWRDGDDVIYRVPRQSASLAHVMTRADLVPRTPVNGIDLEPLRPYVAALENPVAPRTSFRWTSDHTAEIVGDVPAGSIISVQMTYHAGWHASRGTINTDPFGFTVLDPQCAGPCSVTLSYDGGAEMKLARAACWIALAASILCIIPWRTKRATDN